MPSGDGLLARVKPFGGRLLAVALRAIADAADECGNGVVELTSRGNLQIRGLTASSAPRFAAAMLAAGLADPDPARESRRNVITMPPYDDALAAEIEGILANIEGLAAKFCVAIGQAEADIQVSNGVMTVQGIDLPYNPDALHQTAIAAKGKRLPSEPRPATPPAGLLFLRYGQTDAAGLRALAGLTNQARTTPYRAFHVPPGCNPTGFIADPDDPRLRIAACPGAPACASATTPTRADADFLAAQGIADVHVSGCAKGCAYPRAGRTLVARDGRYDLVDHGRAGDPARLAGLAIAQAAALL